MLGYRTGETPVVQVHVKKPKPFKWLRKLFRRLKFKHARFDDGKFARDQKDIEKWHEDAPLTKADYPDHRWQSVTRPRKSRNKNKDTQLRHHGQTDKPKSKHREHPKPNNHQSQNDQSNILDMDILKQVLNRDPSYTYGKTIPEQTVCAEIHSRPSGLTDLRKRSKEVLATTSRTVEETVRANVSGYFPLEKEGSPCRSPQSSGRPTPYAQCDTPASVGGSKRKDRSVYKSAYPEMVSITHVHMPHPRHPATESSFQGETSQVSASQTQREMQAISQLDVATCQHENDNDLNHLRAFEKKVFNKKPKNRKSKKKRVRRKGKYRELETVPSVESLTETSEVQVPGQFQGHSLTRKCKPVSRVT